MNIRFGRNLPTKTVSLLLAGSLALAVPAVGIGAIAVDQSVAEAATTTNLVSAKLSRGQAKANLASAQKEFNKAQKQADSARAALEKARSSSSAAKTDLANKKKAVADAQTARDAAEKSYQAAQKAPVKYSTLDFFKAAGSQNAVNALTSSRYASFTDFSKRGDATNAAMVFKSLEYLDQFNKLRSSIGLSQLKVTDYMMATAEADVNWSRTHIEHARQFNVGENLAWNYDDPFKGWYDAEKALYDQGNRTYSEIGHYLNIINTGYRSTGFATALGGLYGGYTTGQTFSHNENMGGQAYTVAQWRDRFQSWTASMGDDGQAAIDAALESYKKADSACDEAEAAYDKAQDAQETAAYALEDAQDDYESAASDLSYARKNLNRAEKAYARLGGDGTAVVDSDEADAPVLNVKTVSRASVSGALTGKAATSIVLGSKVKAIAKGAFAGQKQIRTLIVKSKKLTKSSAKGSLKGSGVTSVKVQVSSSSQKNAGYVKKYKKIFTKKVAGKNVAIMG